MIFVCAVSAAAQTRFKPQLHSVDGKIIRSAKNDTLRILAVMVEFQPDRYDATYGDGTFGSIYTGENRTRTDILDPLPHDRAYFENHLRFAKNYFEKESRGKLVVTYTVLPNVITLDNTMRVYSPEVNSDDFTGVANMTEEAWEKAYAQNPAFDFAAYDMFVLFHAGVGRDVSVPGSLGLERDIPSLFMSLKQYREIYGEDFDGISVGNFKITNTAVLPETESREVAGITGSVLIELTINGLVASMIGSYLGLPDLYNTETGYSAIGRFGLMDGQAIFSYGGTFPPSLSPFEKMFLGWVEPAVIDSPQSVALNAEEISADGDLTLVKIPINESEYFLAQVRVRDANGDGAKIHYVDETGTTRQIVFTQDEDGFYYYDVSALQGVIVNVDEFDWALPGNGMVIWHIDENVVNAGLDNNTVNNDINHRGVAVVEADGINDIGRTFYDIFGDLVVGEGTENDFWFAGNESHYYENAFTPETKPNSDSYYGTPSGIYLSDFSPAGARMNFVADFQREIEIVKSFKLPGDSRPEFIYASPSNNFPDFAVQSDDDVFIYDFEGNLVKTVSDFSDVKIIADFSPDENAFVLYGAKDTRLVKYDTRIDSIETVVSYGSPIKKLFKRTESDTYYVLTVNSDSSFVYEHNSDTASYSYKCPFAAKDAIIASGVAFVNDSLFISAGFDAPFKSGNEILSAAIVSQVENTKTTEYAVLLEENNLFEIVELGENKEFVLVKSFSVSALDTVKSFSVVVDNGGQAFITFASDGKLYAYNLQGALAEGFPLEDENDNKFVNYALEYSPSAGFTDLKLISQTESGNLNFHEFRTSDVSTKAVYSLGSLALDGLTIAKHNDALYLIAVDRNDNLYLLEKNEAFNNALWQGKYAACNNNYVIANFVVEESAATLIKAYNWPNPVSEGVTHFRIRTPEDARVNIKIFDLSGYKIDELNGNVFANSDADIDWNVNDVQSDVYFARVEVTLASGKKDFKIVKVAVVK
jgi:M6 family metalloprotease-like protein